MGGNPACDAALDWDPYFINFLRVSYGCFDFQDIYVPNRASELKRDPRPMSPATQKQRFPVLPQEWFRRPLYW